MFFNTESDQEEHSWLHFSSHDTAVRDKDLTQRTSNSTILSKTRPYRGHTCFTCSLPLPDRNSIVEHFNEENCVWLKNGGILRRKKINIGQQAKVLFLENGQILSQRTSWANTRRKSPASSRVVLSKITREILKIEAIKVIRLGRKYRADNCSTVA